MKLPLLLTDEQSRAFGCATRDFQNTPEGWQIIAEIAEAVHGTNYIIGISAVLRRWGKLRNLFMFQAWMGIDHRPVQREVMTLGLRELAERHSGDPERGVFVVGRYGYCAECAELQHKWMTFAEAIARQPLPHARCTSEEFGLNGFCRCTYYPARPEHEGLAYMTGGSVSLAVALNPKYSMFGDVAADWVVPEPAAPEPVEIVGGPLDGTAKDLSADPPDVAAGGVYIWSDPNTVKWKPFTDN